MLLHLLFLVHDHLVQLLNQFCLLPQLLVHFLVVQFYDVVLEHGV